MTDDPEGPRLAVEWAMMAERHAREIRAAQIRRWIRLVEAIEPRRIGDADERRLLLAHLRLLESLA